MKAKSGFTLIETLITIGIFMMLTSILLIYNRSSNRQIILLREKAKIIDAILRAKSNSINTLIIDEPVCGYGVHWEKDFYLIFQDRATNCSLSDRIYTAGDSQELVERFNLPTGISFSKLDVRDILFMPPNPTVFFDDHEGGGEATLTLSTDNNQSFVDIKLNNAGQISE